MNGVCGLPSDGCETTGGVGRVGGVGCRECSVSCLFRTVCLGHFAL